MLWQTLLQCINIRRVAKSVESECRLHSNVDEVHDASPAAAGQQRKGGRGLVRGQNPAALQITLLTISTGTPQSGRTVYV